MAKKENKYYPYVNRYAAERAGVVKGPNNKDRIAVAPDYSEVGYIRARIRAYGG